MDSSCVHFVGHNIGDSHRRRQVAVLTSAVVSVTSAKVPRGSVSIAVSTSSDKFIAGYRQVLFCEGVFKKNIETTFRHESVKCSL